MKTNYDYGKFVNDDETEPNNNEPNNNEKKKGSSKMKKWLISILAIIIIGGGVTAGVMIVKNQPENVAISAVAGVFDDVLERPEIEPLINMLKGGSVSVNMTELTYNDGKNDLFEEEGISKLGGKIYFSNDNKIFVENAGVDFEDGSIRGDIFLSDELLYVKSDILDGAYGVKFEDALDDFEDSIFHKNGKSDFCRRRLFLRA